MTNIEAGMTIPTFDLAGNISRVFGVQSTCSSAHVRLPPQFVATKYPGYFWNDILEQLYSVKVTGTLKPLKITRPSKYNNIDKEGYRLSVKGIRRWMFVDYLRSLKRESSIFPIYTS